MSDLSHFWWQSGKSGPDPSQIGSSLRFRRPSPSSGTYLSRSVATSGDRKKWTYSTWIKRGKGGISGQGGDYMPAAISAYLGNNYDTPLYFAFATDADCAEWYFNNLATRNVTTQVFRDFGAWYHLVAVLDTDNSVDTYRMRTYVNGAEVASYSRRDIPAQGTLGYINDSSRSHYIGWTGAPSQQFFEGYMAEVHFVDGQALNPTTFGEFNADGVWVPKKVSGVTYGTNGFHLAFDDVTNIGKDSSGNGNHFTATGFELTTTTSTNYDWVADSPTNNYATLNPLVPGSSALTNGNLSAGGATVQPTITPGSGNWYYEVDGTGYQWNGQDSSWTGRSGAHNFGQQPFRSTPPAGFKALCTANLPSSALPATITGTFTGNGSADGPFIYTGCIPGRIQYGTVDVTYGNRLASNDVDFLANGFKVRSTVSNSGNVNYTVTTTHSDGEHSGKQVPFGGAGRAPATACSN